eukprot:941630-Amphidinium_carterae.1
MASVLCSRMWRDQMRQAESQEAIAVRARFGLTPEVHEDTEVGPDADDRRKEHLHGNIIRSLTQRQPFIIVADFNASTDDVMDGQRSSPEWTYGMESVPHL